MTKYVFVNGGTKKQRALVEDVAWWFCEKYFSRFKSFNIDIDLVNIEGEVNGWCMPIDRRACHIEIDKKQKGDDFITCILHELVHVKQYLKGELKDISALEQRWKGESHISIDYYDLPWEIGAYHLQEVLLEEYKNA